MKSFASNSLPQARTKQVMNGRQPNLAEKRVMLSSSLVVLRLARYPRGSSSTASQMDKAIVDHVLVQQHVQIHRSRTECVNAPDRLRLLSLIPVCPLLTLFCKEQQLQLNLCETARNKKKNGNIKWPFSPHCKLSALITSRWGGKIVFCQLRRTA